MENHGVASRVESFRSYIGIAAKFAVDPIVTLFRSLSPETRTEADFVVRMLQPSA